MKGRWRLLGTLLLSALFVLGAGQAAGRAEEMEKSPVLAAMELELQRSMEELGEKSEPPPYFISYLIRDRNRTMIHSSFGALQNSNNNRSRMLDVDVRVGEYQLDSSHRIRGDRFSFMFDRSIPVSVPLEDDIAALRSRIWLATDKRYKAAREKLIKVETNKAVKVEEEDQAADFTRENPEVYIGKLATIEIDEHIWTEKLKRLSALFRRYPHIYESNVNLDVEAVNDFFINSEGSLVQQGRIRWDLSIYAATRADDGMELYRYESFDSHSEEKLPSEEEIGRVIEQLAKDVVDLREAPVIEPYTGPAILTGRASAVFFHEIFGHRIEGHRQKDEEEGQTFTKKVNQAVLPDFLSVYDDPTLEVYGETDLNGHYLYDDEGVRAQRVIVVENGILKNFLMSRSPISGFEKSNGHGRKQVGSPAVGRQGNLIIEASSTVSEDELRQLLIETCEAHNKPFGLIFKDISGGFTSTRRMGTQAFAVIPIMVYRVFTDGRPDELVRGVDLIGTPLVSFSKIIACGESVGVFNGTCGAESGAIPVSGVSPSILTAEIEIQKKEKSAERPPLLPPPGRRDDR